MEEEKEAEGGKEEHTYSILGLFGCLRAILPHIEPTFNEETNRENSLDSFICVYELCLYYTKFHANHNVVNAALETLAQLLQSPPRCVAIALLSNSGITRSMERISRAKDKGILSLSRISLSTTTVSEDTFETASYLFEREMLDIPEINPKVEKWIMDSAEALPVVQRASSKVKILSAGQPEETSDKDLENYSGLVIGTIDGTS